MLCRRFFLNNVTFLCIFRVNRKEFKWGEILFCYFVDFVFLRDFFWYFLDVVKIKSGRLIE